MGKAIIIPDLDFSNAGFGRVTIPVLLTGLSINGNDSYIGSSAQLTVTYTPSNTSQRNVNWSIVSGSQYANINSQNGFLSILVGARNSAVVVRATSTDNSSIYAEKTITVTYSDSSVTLLEWIYTGRNNYVDTGVKLNNDYNYEIKAEFTNGINSDAFFVRDTSEFCARYFSGLNYGAGATKTIQISGTDVYTIRFGTPADSSKIEVVANETIVSEWTRTSAETTNNVKLYCATINGSKNSANPAKIYYFKVFDNTDNNNLVLSLVPVRRNGTPCFMDEVSGNFYDINRDNPALPLSEIICSDEENT